MINYLNKYRLLNKKSIVLGGLGLLGLSITEALLSAGSDVLILDINRDKGKNINKYFNSNKVKFKFFDTSKINKIEINLKKIIKIYTPDVFINCSYPATKDWYKSSFKENTLEIMRKNIDIH